MAKTPAKKTSRKRKKTAPPSLRARLGAALRRPVRWVLRGVLGAVVVLVLWVGVYRWIDPPTTFYIAGEARREGGVARDWVDWDDIAPVMARSVVAAEDANFCRHWGFDVAAIREVIESGQNRGASTISQQVVKNTFLWHGRSWWRKALEAGITPLMEALWPKRRILEVYLNVAEFDRGVFGVEAAAWHYFGVPASALSARQASRLAAVLAAPKQRSASRPSDFVVRRGRSIADGAATIRADGRADCFED